MSNQYTVKHQPVEGGYQVTMYDGEDVIFESSVIKSEFKLIADVIHSTLEVAIAFGFVKQPPESDV